MTKSCSLAMFHLQINDIGNEIDGMGLKTYEIVIARFLLQDRERKNRDYGALVSKKVFLDLTNFWEGFLKKIAISLTSMLKTTIKKLKIDFLNIMANNYKWNKNVKNVFELIKLMRLIGKTKIGQVLEDRKNWPSSKSQI